MTISSRGEVFEYAHLKSNVVSPAGSRTGVDPPSSADHWYPNKEESPASAASKSSTTMPTWN
jgi:hypothetical protein